MTATLRRTPTDFWDKWAATRATNPPSHAVESSDDPPPVGQRSLGRGALRTFLRFLITLGIGVGGTLTWQAYGDEARQIMAEQLGWIAPQSAPTALATQSAPAALASGAAAAPSVDPQQLNTMSADLAAVRQSVEQLAMQVASGQQRLSGEIARLQASEQDMINKMPASPPRPTPVAARKPSPPPLTVAPSSPATPAAPPR